MVVISELASIFWGVALEGNNKKYSQITERPVHISMAALDPFHSHDENPVSLIIEHDGKSYVLCTLQHGKQFQQPLDLEFASGEELTFSIRGKGVVHLSGYVMPEDEFPELNDDVTDSDIEEKEEEEVESDEETSPPSHQNKKRQNSGEETKKSSKKAKMTIEDLDEDDDDDDSDAEFIDDEAAETSEEEEDEDEDDLEKELLHEDSDDEDVSSDDAEEMDVKNEKKAVTVDRKQEMRKKVKKDSAAAAADVKRKPTVQSDTEASASSKPVAQHSSAVASDTSQMAEGKKKKKKNKKKKNTANQQQMADSSAAVPAAAAKQSKRTVEGGVVVEDVKEGHGPEAKPGKLLRVYYTGRLANGKVFDSTTTGNGLKFKLGIKEVISGWDVGLSGMKVGGKRKLVVPAKMGYGSQQAGSIPPNSTLHFDVELRAVN